MVSLAIFTPEPSDVLIQIGIVTSNFCLTNTTSSLDRF